jgi:hypothetical protein
LRAAPCSTALTICCCWICHVSSIPAGQAGVSSYCCSSVHQSRCSSAC